MIDEVYELFIELGANDEQIDFPIIYTNAREGIAKNKFINLKYKDILILAIPGLFFGSDITLWHWSISKQQEFC